MTVIIETMKKIAVLIIILGLAVFASADNLPRPRGYLNDFAGVVDGASAQQIESACASIERSTGVEISVITIESLDGSTIEQEGLRYLEGWGVGKKGKDNGVVIIVAIKDRKIRIETGYGMEGILPDSKAGEIIRYDITPRFKQGDYGGGLLAAVYKIGKIAGGEIVTYPKTPRQNTSIGTYIYFIFFIILIISSFSRRRRGGSLGLLWFLTGFGMGRSGGWGGSSGWGGGSSGGSGGFGGFGGGMGGGGGASGGW
jgi:uncharacterized protein